MDVTAEEFVIGLIQQCCVPVETELCQLDGDTEKQLF